MTRHQEHERLTASLRLVAAALNLAVFLTDPEEAPAVRPLSVAVLSAFVVYSAVVLVAGSRRRDVPPTWLAPWIDIAWVTLLVAVSAGLSGVFFPLYLFAVLEASFASGFRTGVAATAASALSYAVVGALTPPTIHGHDLSPFLYRPLYLTVLGYLTAVWGGHEVRSRTRLALLRAVTDLSNPRFGVERTVSNVLEAIRTFYGASSCRLVVAEAGPARPWMQSAERGGPATPRRGEVPPELARLLLPEPRGAAFLIGEPRLPSWRAARDPVMRLHDPPASEGTEGPAALARVLTTALDARAVLSVPFRASAGADGRLYVLRRDGPRFGAGEIAFLGHVLDQVAPVLENIRLVDRLASDAADDARRRIALDLHDSVIQPYLGLRIGLSAVQTALASGWTDKARGDVDRLMALADGELQAMRGYVRGLETTEPSGGALLDEGLRRLCRRLEEATGVAVEVSVEGPLAVGDRLGAEVLQMVAEALSNVRRHTTAQRARVRLENAGGRLVLAVENERDGEAPAGFLPRSLAERAEALGGTLRVDPDRDGLTSVQVEVPL